ncbi:MAG: sigma-E processing peptidase SpoIIGA [Clostridia bacterium]|nr:sigma-E processing peptidase SpoIIGA [Clostridia bacterium]
MVIYADILIAVNLIVDYFLILLTGRIVRLKPPLWRNVLAAGAAAICTLVIFLPRLPAAAEAAIDAAISVAVCLIAFGAKSIRRVLLTSAVFLAVSFTYAGAMLALWYIFEPGGMIVNNSVVYFNVSPLFLIGFSVLAFFIFSVASSLLARRHGRAQKCFVTVTFGGVSADFAAVIDSGNSLSDPFSGAAVIIADRKKCFAAFGELNAGLYPDRYRAIPCGTVSGNVLLDGFRCESAKIAAENRTASLTSPILALSKTPLCDCEAIVNPRDLE